MRKKLQFIIIFLIIIGITKCDKIDKRPNIIFILADDMVIILFFCFIQK